MRSSVPLLKARLSLMMFLQFAIWGAWLPILYPFLLGHRRFDLEQVSMILAAGALGAILGPFIAGEIADRRFATERFLAVSHLAGAFLVYSLADVTSFPLFLGRSLLYGVVYAPTLALTNSLAFRHLVDRDRDFPGVRLWGTIGWIAAGIAVGHYLLHFHTPVGSPAEVAAAQDAGRAGAFRLSGLLGLVMAGYCLTLPHTPPVPGGRGRSAVFAALSEVRRMPLALLFALAVPVSIVHQFYFVHTAAFLSEVQRKAEGAGELARSINRALGVGGGGLMTIGQMSEILVLAAIPLVAKRVSRKTLLATGLLAYAARMALFAYCESLWALLLGVALHGLCFGCFLFVAFLVVDEETSATVKASAQNLFNLVIVGIGISAGSWFATKVVGTWATRPAPDGSGAPVVDYRALFSVPLGIALGCLVILMIFYPRRRSARAPTE
jgi:nucleoside transporter